MFKKFIPIFTALVFLAATAACYAGQQATIMLTVTLADQLISNLADAPDAFSPNSDGNSDITTISYQLNANSNVSVNIYDQLNNLVRVLKNNVPETAGVQSAVWDGKNSLGDIVADGTYTYEVTSATETKYGQTTVDNKFLDLTEPLNNSIITIGSRVVYHVIPSEYISHESNVKLLYRPQGTQEWIDPDADFEQFVDGSWVFVDEAANGGNDGDVLEVTIAAEYQDLNGQTRNEYTSPIALTFSNDFNVYNLFESDNAFSPNGDGDFEETGINFTINRDALVSLKIFDINNKLVRTLGENISTASGDINVPWDGRDDSSNIMPEGEYVYRITADDGLGTVIEKQGSVFLDNHFMSITEPAEGTILRDQVTFKALTSESVFQESNVLFYSRQKGTAEWNIIDDANPPVKQPDGSWTQAVETAGALNAIQEIRVGADYYSYDHELRREYSIANEYQIVNDLHIIESDVSINPFSPNIDGQYDSTQIEYGINASADVTIKIFDSSHNLVRTLQENAAMPMGENSAVWDGRDDSANFVSEGSYTYEITAQDTQQSINDTAQGSVIIDNHFMRIIAPVGGSNLTQGVTLIAMPSANTQNPRDIVFSYRTTGSATWTDIISHAEQQSDGSWTIEWNVDSLSSGNYEARVFANYNDLDNAYRSEYSTPNSYVVPEYIKITNVSDSPDAFSPDNDEQFDENTLTYNINRDSTVRIGVYDQGNNLIRTLKDNISETAGTQTAVWDGSDDQGAIVSDGTYNYVIEATDSDNYQAQYQKSVAVDNTIIVFDPTSGSNVSGQVNIKISPSPYISIQGAAFHSRLSGAVAWNSFGNGIDQGDGTWNVTWDTSELENGNYEINLTLYYYDADNNFRQQDILFPGYNLSNGINILNVSDSPDAFSPNGDGNYDASTISYRLVNSDGLVTIKLYDTSDSLVRTLRDTEPVSIGEQVAEWDGKDDQGDVAADGVYLYTIEAIDNESNIANAQGEVTLDAHPLIVSPSDEIPVTGVLHVSAIPSQYCKNITSVYFTVIHQSLTNYREIIGNGEQQPDGSWTADWDSTTFIDGIYKFRSDISYSDQDNKSRYDSIYSYFKVTNGNMIVDISDSPDPISPNGDGRYEQTVIKYTLGLESNVDISIVDESDDIIRILQSDATHMSPMISAYVWWDGKDTSGSVVQDGTYTYKIHAIDESGYEKTETGEISVDNQVADIIDPPAYSSVRDSVILKIRPSQYLASVNSISVYVNNSRIGYAAEQADGTWQIPWDTTSTENGNAVVRLYLNYTDAEGKSRSESAPEVKYLVSNNIDVSWNAFSPNADGAYDFATIYYGVSSNGTATVKIYDHADQLIRTLVENAPIEAGTKHVTWDGKNNSEVVVDDGVYTYKIDVSFSGGGSDHSEGTVTVDNNFIAITSPAQGSDLSDIATINLSKPSHIQTITSILTYYRKTGTSKWHYLPAGRSYVSSETWALDWDTTTVANGDYEIYLSGKYKDLNGLSREENTLPVSYTVANEFNITSVSDAPDAFSPNGDGQFDVSTIKYFINSDATVNVKVYDSEDTLVRTITEDDHETAGDHNVIWDGKDNNGDVLSDGTYTYVIEAVDSQNTVATKNGESSIDNNAIDITEPISETTLSGQQEFKISFSAFVNNVSGAYLKTNLVLFHAEKDNAGNWSIPVDTKTISNGTVEFILRATYYDKNNTRRYESRTFTYTVCNENPDVSDLQVTPNPFSPDGSGTWIDLDTGEVFQEPAPGLVLDDETKISFIASDYGVFDIKILDQDGQIIKQLNSGALYPDPETQRIEVVWNGSQNNSSTKVNNGTYQVVVNPGDPEKEISQDIIVDKIPFIRYTDVSPNPFAPQSSGDNNKTTISYSIAENAFVDIYLYDANDELVTNIQDNVLLDSGEHQFIWYGLDTQGQFVVGGNYKIIINAHTEFGAQAYPARLPLFICSTSDVRISAPTFDPYDSILPLQIYYSLLNDTHITLIMYNDNDEAVRTLVNNEVRLAGEQTEVWDGKDNNGDIVPDGFYYFKITNEIEGQEYVQYDPSHTDGTDISHSLAVNISDFDPQKNIPCTLNVDVPEPVYLFTRIRPGRYAHDDTATIRVLKYKEPFEAGHFQFYWDGRDENGALVSSGSYFIGVWAYRPNINSVLVIGGTPRITLESDSISPVHLRPYANPYRSSQSSIQAAVSFTISRNASVNAGVYDNAGILVASLADEEFMIAGRHSLYWNGYSDNGELLPKGDYRVVIQAHHEQNYSDVVQLHIELGF